MKNSSIILAPNPILKQKARKVTDFGSNLRALSEAMVKIMREYNGMGLAAPQINQSVRLIVIEYEPNKKGEYSERSESAIPLTILVNPSVTDSSRQTDWMDEGCLSIPGVEVPVQRPKEVNVLAQDTAGNRVKIRAKGLYARILQHEIDHLDGILMTQKAYPNLEEINDKRILFFGTPDHAIPYLSALASTNAQIVGVVTETDKPAGRHKRLTAPPIKIFAKMLGLPVYQFESLKNNLAREKISQLRPDVAIVVAYGKIIPTSILKIAPRGFLNIHYSLLPALRGPSPYQTAILQGLAETGVTIFKLDKGLDTGPIIAKKRVKISGEETSKSLLEKLILKSVPLLLDILPSYLTGKRIPKKQPGFGSSQTSLIKKKDGLIDWSLSVEDILRRIRAFLPWPTSYAKLNDERLIVHEAHLEHGLLALDVVQPSGKAVMSFADFARGKRQNWLTFLAETDKVKITKK